jgi:hypothetical protein
MKPIDALFAQVKWTCTNCGKPADPNVTCSCSEKCECGHTKVRGTECTNGVWHATQAIAEEMAELIVEDMAQSYRLFQKGYMVDRLKRAVIRQAHEVMPDVFDGVEAARRTKHKRSR